MVWIVDGQLSGQAEVLCEPSESWTVKWKSVRDYYKCVGACEVLKSGVVCITD